MTRAETVSEVDLDELFNTLDPKTVADFKNVIKGFATSYRGVGEEANQGFKYLNPFLSTSRRTFAELTRDTPALEQLIVNGSKLSHTVASRRGDLSQLVANLDGMMNAIARQRTSLRTALAELPDFMRNFNTTAVNLRVDPRRPRPARRRVEAGRRPARPVLPQLPRRLRRPRPDRPRPRPDRRDPRQGQRPRRPDPPAAAAREDRGRARQPPRRPAPRRPARVEHSAARLARRARLLPRLLAGADRLVRRLRALRDHRRERRHRPDRHDLQHVLDRRQRPADRRSHRPARADRERAVLPRGRRSDRCRDRQLQALPGLERAAGAGRQQPVGPTTASTATPRSSRRARETAPRHRRADRRHGRRPRRERRRRRPAHLLHRVRQRLRADQRLRGQGRRRRRRNGHRSRRQREQACRRQGRAERPGLGARRGHDLPQSAAVADRRVLHRLHPEGAAHRGPRPAATTNASRTPTSRSRRRARPSRTTSS